MPDPTPPPGLFAALAAQAPNLISRKLVAGALTKLSILLVAWLSTKIDKDLAIELVRVVVPSLTVVGGAVIASQGAVDKAAQVQAGATSIADEVRAALDASGKPAAAP